MAKPINYCSVPYCKERVRSNGFCNNHLYAFRKYGDATKLVQKQHHGKTLAERLEIYTKRGPDCWDWIGHKDLNGYGRLNVGGKPLLAHRLSYLVHLGSIPDDKALLHKCDRPCCVNPAHLFLGTQTDNLNDMYAKGRDRKRGMKGSEHHQAKLDEATVRAIRASKESGPATALCYGISNTQVYD